MDRRRTDISICLLIGLSFLWTGCGYLSWFYHLADFYTASSVDMLTEVIGYLFQAAGLVAFALHMKQRGPQSTRPVARSLGLLSLAALVMDALASMSPSGAVSLIFGYAMNIIFGMIAGVYLTVLAEHASPSRMGIIFGAGYGIGSVGSYLLSLPGGGFLSSPYVFIIYTLIIILTLPLAAHITSASANEASSSGSALSISIPEPDSQSRSSFDFLWIPGLTILFLSCVKSGGFYFPTVDLAGYNVSLELSRAFYAAGLIAAGLINDKRRSAGAVLCVAALVFPFFTMIAGSHSNINYALWIGSYIFFGFYSVYRVLLFVDISRSSSDLAWLACMGLMWGRLGDAAGAAIGIRLSREPIALITVMALLFVICIFMFFRLFQAVYMVPAKETPDYVISFAAAYGLSQRETGLLRLILDGRTNKEIADELYISDNTVKFHVRNLLHKTGCSNRKELLSLFNSYCSPA